MAVATAMTSRMAHAIKTRETGKSWDIRTSKDPATIAMGRVADHMTLKDLMGFVLFKASDCLNHGPATADRTEAALLLTAAGEKIAEADDLLKGIVRRKTRSKAKRTNR